MHSLLLDSSLAIAPFVDRLIIRVSPHLRLRKSCLGVYYTVIRIATILFCALGWPKAAHRTARKKRCRYARPAHSQAKEFALESFCAA
jgi:hypothetical protein